MLCVREQGNLDAVLRSEDNHLSLKVALVLNKNKRNDKSILKNPKLLQ